jgi:hypothetical protein
VLDGGFVETSKRKPKQPARQSPQRNESLSRCPTEAKTSLRWLR